MSIPILVRELGDPTTLVAEAKANIGLDVLKSHNKFLLVINRNKNAAKIAKLRHFGYKHGKNGSLVKSLHLTKITRFP